MRPIPTTLTSSTCTAWWATRSTTTSPRCWSGGCSPIAPASSSPNERLHILPIPTSIPRHQWRRTTLRIQHLAGLTDEDRREQFEKYGEADPEGDFQADYSNLLVPTGRSVSGSPDRWSSRLSLMGEAPVAPGA